MEYLGIKTTLEIFAVEKLIKKMVETSELLANFCNVVERHLITWSFSSMKAKRFENFKSHS